MAHRAAPAPVGTRPTQPATEAEPGYLALTASARALVDAQLRTCVSGEVALDIAHQIDVLVDTLLEDSSTAPLGVSFPQDGRPLRSEHGNAVIGTRNAIAPPLVVMREHDGRCWAEFTLGATYEGPPGFVHGGVCALILDQVLGDGAAAAGHPGMTAGLTLRFHRPTPLGRLRAEAELHEGKARKALVQGRLFGPEGQLTVSAEGVFVMPRHLRV
jgi:acyl-coenzyme A thioesterase PaaI-like protein